MTQGFLHACDVDQDEILEWEQAWQTAERQVEELNREFGVSTVMPTEHLRRIRPEENTDSEPHPEQVNTHHDLRYELVVLKIRAGDPSLRLLARAMGEHGSYFGASTLSEVFKGQRKLSVELLHPLVTTLLSRITPVTGGDPEPWRSMAVWEQAWARARFTEVRPDLTRRRRYGELVLLTPAAQEGPATGVVEEMEPRIAAALLASLATKMASDILAEMDPRKAKAVVEAMWLITNRSTDGAGS